MKFKQSKDYLAVLKYRLTDIIKPTKLYLLYIIVYIHIVFHRRKKSFLIVEIKPRHSITLQKNTEKTILLYITGSQPLVRGPVRISLSAGPQQFIPILYFKEALPVQN